MRRTLPFFTIAVIAAAMALSCGDSDGVITAKIRAKIAADRLITSASHIDVSTRSKVVTLNGTAESQGAKQRAVALARGTEGVVSVADSLTIAPPSAPANPPTGFGEKASQEAGKAAEAVDDAAITVQVKAKLLADKNVSGTNIEVHTKDGVVTLTGLVASDQERSRAVEIATGVHGVTRVDDQLTVQHS